MSGSRASEARFALARRLVGLKAKQRVALLLEDEGGRPAAQLVPAEDVYNTILEVGLGDSADLVRASSPEQFRTYVDLAAWQRDRVDVREVLSWLSTAHGSDEAAFLAKLKAIDLELLELLFKRLVVIHDLEENPDVNPPGATMESVEGKYLLEFKVEGAEEAALRKLIREMTTQQPFEIARFLESVRWEMPAELEETAYRFRAARLEDLGFPPLEEALKLYTWVDPAPFRPAASKAQALAAVSQQPDYVAAALAALDANERENMETEVRGLVNAALVAEAAEPGDPAAIRRVSEHARDTLNLGLEHVSGGDPAEAVKVVREHTLVRLFQVGFSLTLRVRRQVEKLARESRVHRGGVWLALDEESHALAALMLKRPKKALKVQGAEPVPFRYARELAEAEQLQERVRGQTAVLLALLGNDANAAVAPFSVEFAQLRPQRFMAAAVAQSALGHPPRPVPLAPEELTRLCAVLFSGDATVLRITEHVAARVTADLARATGKDAAVIGPMVERILRSFADDFGGTWVRETRVDPARVNSLPVAGLLPV